MQPARDQPGAGRPARAAEPVGLVLLARRRRGDAKPFRRGLFSRVGLVAGDRDAGTAVTPAALRERVAPLLLDVADGRASVVKPGSARFGRRVADPLVLRDDLRAEQQQRRGDLEAQQHDDRGRQRAVDDVDLRQRREVPDQHVARDLPEQRRGHAADQRVAPAPAGRPASPGRPRSARRSRRRGRAGRAARPETPFSDHSRPNSSTFSWPIACRLPATSVTSSRPTPSERM